MKKMSTVGKVLTVGGLVAAAAGIASAIFGKKNDPEEETCDTSDEDSVEDEE